MISVAEALNLVCLHHRDYGIEHVDLLETTGRVLAQDVFADRDFPPFARVMMDGIAINYRSFEQGRRDFRIERMQPAGQPQQSLDDIDCCIEVMTGAVLPYNTDVVIPYEDCMIENGAASVQIKAVRLYQNVHLQGTDAREGDQLLKANHRITPAMIGMLATVGKDKVPVRRLPTVAICATGDELVDVGEKPMPHQIRRSNSYMLAAALQAERITADTYHLPDNESMKHTLDDITNRYDVVLLSGAVSKGKYDLLPDVLGSLGMNTIFHGIAQRPGKPFLFGTIPGKAIVFGFPGNPVSTLVCYVLYFLPWLHTSLRYDATLLHARLTAPVDFNPALTYHLLITLKLINGVLEATPVPAANSGDLLGLQRADAILSLPANRKHFDTGEVFPVTVLSGWKLEV